MQNNGWEFWIDRGGTFTDIVACAPDGALIVRKLLSQNVRRYSDAAIQGIYDVLDLASGEKLPEGIITAVKLGTTVATNALLERKGDDTLLITTRGFADGLRIGYQNRPDIFARKIVLPEQLYCDVVEADERVTVDGAIEIPLDEKKLASSLAKMREKGLDTCAIVFMHGHAHPQHEKTAARIAKAAGFTQISCSHEVSPLIKFVTRGETTVADAYLSPVLKRYIDKVRGHLGSVPVLFMQSNGGLADADHFRGKDSLLSGPAGGIVGAAKTCAAIGITKLLSFDMGGTSTDVAHFNGEYERRFDNTVAGFRISAPMMDIHTVAAGGGSIVQFRSGRLQVGPQSAGADPGPACYRNGGPLTVTDCNLFLGRIQEQFFPRVFGPEGNEPVDSAIVKFHLDSLLSSVNATYQTKWTAAELAENLIAIAVEKMANAIKRVSIERGHDVADYALACFGGAGGQHACKIAEALSLRKVVVHPLAGVLSAVGIGLSEVRVIKQRTIERGLEPALMDKLKQSADQLDGEVVLDLAEQHVAPNDVQLRRTVLMRYSGTDFSMPILFTDAPTMATEFRSQHLSRYGFVADKPLVIEAVCVEGMQKEKKVPGTRRDTGDRTGGRSGAQASVARVQIYCQGRWHEVDVIRRESLPPARPIAGPALFIDDTSTTVLEPGWVGECNELGYLIMQRLENEAVSGSASAQDNAGVEQGATPDPARLELFNNLFTQAAEEMGLQLQNTSHSVNIKERLDFSCAIFDRTGRLIANAPHIPVHLGSMSESVQSLIASHSNNLRPGDSFVLNNPFNGGTHLPDVTVISPVFGDNGGGLLFFVASRGHHAEIGGITPGSMPANSTTLVEEGVVIDNFLLVRDGQFHEKEIVDLLLDAPYPSRNTAQNIADLKAQVAANTRGSQKLLELVGRYGAAVVELYMQFVRENATVSVEEVIDRLKDGQFSCEMDNGSKVAVRIKVDRIAKKASIDFGDTTAQVATNLNAPRSICRAAVLYVFRTLVDQQIPLNDGCLAPISINLPKGSIIDPNFPAAVVAGNVETSQAITDCLYGALGELASAQGTMNNLTFGNQKYQYYETICGGAGAGPDFDGATAVHTHMTNSRLTDPEILELRYPVVLESFSIRKGSGGKGKHNGGDGVVRRLRFCEAMTVSILSQHRRVPPFGLAGGGAGTCGRNYIIRADGRQEEMPGTATVELEAGDVIVIETPGGGAYGAPVS